MQSARRISVLQFSNQEVRGGAEEHILTLLQLLDRRFFRLHLACTPPLYEKLRANLPSDVVVFRTSLIKPSDLNAGIQVGRILHRHRIDILHSHMFGASLFASPIGWLCRTPVIIETPHVKEHWRHGWFKGHYFIDRCIGRLVDHYIAVSGANAEYLAQVKGLPTRKIKIIRSAADLNRFDPRRTPPAGLRESLGFAPQDPVLVVAGRLEPQKGHRVLLDAMPAVVREFPRVRLVCLSDGQLREDLERQVRVLALTGNVRFVGYQPDIRDWLALADISILPSFFEGLPLIVIESLAAGRPVVASAVDGIPEVLAHGENGLLVPAGDSVSLGEAICVLLKNPRLRQEMARKGRERVVQEFGIGRLIRETHELYLRAWAQYEDKRNPNRRRDTVVGESNLTPRAS